MQLNPVQAKPKDFKLLGQAALFNIIRTSEPISRTELAHISGFSVPTITSILDTFQTENLITMSGEGESSGGRRPALFGFNPDAKRVVALHLSPHGLTVALVNLGGDILAKTGFPFTYTAEPARGTAFIIEAVRTFMADAGVSKKDLAGLSVVVPGVTDVVNNDWLTSAPLQWYRAPLGKLLRAHFNIPVFLENDAVCAAWAEHQFGAAQNIHSVTCLTQETGIGIGLTINGQIYRGATGVAGEVTHLKGEGEASVCSCGQHDCVAPLVLPEFLRARACEAVASKVDTLLRPLSGNDPGQITLDLINTALLQGDRFSYTLLSQLGENIATVLVPVINTLNPANITLSGAFVQFGDTLLQSIRHHVKASTITQLTQDLTFAVSTLGDDAVLQGAASLCCEAWLEQRSLAPIWATP